MSIRAHTPKNVAIWWVKRDVRLFDNQALTQALARNKIVLPVFLQEPLLLNGPDWGDFHTHALQTGASALSQNLNHFGSGLLVFKLSPIEAVQQISALISELGYVVSEVYSHEETGLNHTFERDKTFSLWCGNNNIKWYEFTNNGVVRGPIDRDYWDKHFKGYISKSVLGVPKDKLLVSFPDELKQVFNHHLQQNHPPLKLHQAPSEYSSVSERYARSILKDFLWVRGKKYRGGISSMNKAPSACSRLSTQLAWGALSLRTVLQECDNRLQHLVEAQRATPEENHQQWISSLRNFISRLFWHAHFVQKLESEVEMEFQAVNKAFREGVPYITHELDEVEHNKRLQAWLYGETGFPAIDAAMRYYQKHGWLNFRSRAMITSFACNALRLPWQTVMYELSKLMVDYVPGIHVSQIQMQAGITGINAIRIYSPQKQLHDHDPKCHFVRSMIPELRSLKAEQIMALNHENLAPEYTNPIIDFKQESKIMKDALYGISKSVSGRQNAKQVFKKHGSRKRNTSKGQSKPKAKTSIQDTPQLKLF
ncbi:FAD-binding domain-containing protein [Paraglaciecola sp. 2405UD69-4]|uniref:cryptochrome/deoxyribodipyrimidine photo-lyase family protein n=1 Tax=Paraglaciecola sp. 2405UD69-4 TaxID=3391836 RepID=UPI0039C9175F